MDSLCVSDDAVAAFRREGFVVLCRAFDADALTAEVGGCLEDAFRDTTARNSGAAGNTFQYVPLMSGRTPSSIALVSALAGAASRLVGRRCIALRAKGTRYFGSTAWHRDAGTEVVSVGFLAYLAPLGARSGALRVVPGSHRRPYPPPPPGPCTVESVDGVAIESQPGDLVVIDEHLLHASAGGDVRLQWRVDFVVDPVGADEEEGTRRYLAGIFRSGWDGGYDVDRYPSFGPDWRRSGAAGVDRLARLGVFEMADAEEDDMRARRRRSPAADGG